MIITRADSWIKRARGLLFSPPLISGEVLWLSPCCSIHTFGMREDIAVFFLDENNTVIDVRPRVPPNRVVSCLRARSVCEMLPISSAQSGLVSAELSLLLSLKTAT